MSGSSDDFHQIVASLVDAAGLRGEITLHPLPGGANNRVQRVEVNGFDALLKVYFQYAGDPRDRLRAEFAFSTFAWQNGLRCLPQPLACDHQKGLGLYEFVPGRQLLPHEIDEGAVRQALDFYLRLNRYNNLPSASALPTASEAGFSIAEHVDQVERRLQKLNTIKGASGINSQVVQFIHVDLSKTWKSVHRAVCRRVDKLGLELDAEIPHEERCLSPSDFGFHNAILSDDGRLRFIDFEYAGWDDPAKTAVDFFCQPALPVSLNHYDMFVEEVIAHLALPDIYRQRMSLLFPVYQLKWCCIFLNDFLPVDNQRRRFAGCDVDEENWKAGQLQKARQALQNLIL